LEKALWDSVRLSNLPPSGKGWSDMSSIDSRSTGNASRFQPLAVLEPALAAMPDRLRDHGSLSFIMVRGLAGRRHILDSVVLAQDFGVTGDAWGRARDRNPDMQIAVMQKEVAELIANGQPLALFGDCMMLDMNLSSSNLPTGSQVKVGAALLEVTPEPHNGCRKFHARFGNEALRFVSARATRHRNLRGIYMRVIEGGEVHVDDPAIVSFRPMPEAAQSRAAATTS
jgi:MOSC domain-containing protein YiiM